MPKTYLRLTQRNVGLPFAFIIIVLVLYGCETSPSPIIVHQDTWNSVRIMYDPSADPPHDHPYNLTPAQLVQILKGMWVKERNRVIGFGLFMEEQGRPAFSNQEISLLAPYLSQALQKASPKDLVTFYILGNGGKQGSLVTSGGLYVQNGRLYFILANYRSAFSDAANINVTGTELDNRDYPLEPIRRYKFSVGFSPADSWIPYDRARSLPGYQPYPDPALRVVIDLTKLFEKVHP